MKFLITVVAVLCCTATFVASAKKPTLQDKRGLFTNKPRSQRWKFSIKDYVSGSIWPKPQEEARGSILFSLSPENFKFVPSGEKSDVLDAALKRYIPLIFPDSNRSAEPSLGQISSLDIYVKTPYKAMAIDTDESYTLAVNSHRSSLEAYSVWGALRGLETFSQIVYQNESGNYFANENVIYDYPRFHHRGFMIDSSRHFLSVKVIEQFIDALAYGKYNVLHWHIVDSDSFPFVSTTFPTLHQKGAFNPVTHIYKPADVKRVIEYARLRGIRVLPEFDTPGHTDSWFSIPDLLTPCYSGGKPNGNFGPINPTIDNNYAFLEKLFKEVASVFPDSYIHMGGDEVNFDCWKSNPNITAWMKTKGITDYSLLEQYYEQRLLDIVGKLNKKYVIWQEVIDNDVRVQSDTVVNIWKGHGDEWKAEALAVTKKGYKVILSSPWYLNYISYGPDWPGYYKVDPQSFGGSSEQSDLVIGGTACMWGEWVDATNLISRTWARGLAVGERFWSSKDTTNIDDASKRIWEHRCRFLRRGLPAENVIESQYCRHEWMSEST